MNVKTEAKIVILEAGMAEIKEQVNEIRSEIKSISKQLEVMLNTKISEHVNMQAQITLLKQGQERLEKQSNFWRWFSPTLSAALSAAITFLFLNYLQHLK